MELPDVPAAAQYMWDQVADTSFEVRSVQLVPLSSQVVLAVIVLANGAIEKRTIEVADALYGVTVGDDAVSRVVSLKLADLPEDDPRLAARATA